MNVLKILGSVPDLIERFEDLIPKLDTYNFDVNDLVKENISHRPPRHDYHDSNEYSNAILGIFDITTALLHLSSNQKLPLDTFLLLFSNSILPLLLVELRQPLSLLEIMKEQNIPRVEQQKRICTEQERNKTLRYAALTVACNCAQLLQTYLLDYSHRDITFHQLHVCMIVLHCLVNAKCAYILAVVDSLKLSSHEELLRLRAIARSISIEYTDISNEHFAPSPFIVPVKTYLSRDISSTCIGCGGDSDGDGDPIGDREALLDAMSEVSKYCQAVLETNDKFYSTNYTADTVASKCIALCKLWASIDRVAPDSDHSNTLFGHAAMTILPIARNATNEINSATFVSLSPFVLRLLAKPSSNEKGLGCLLLHRLLQADSTVLISAINTMIPILLAALTCCDESSEWSGISFLSCRNMHTLLAATSSSAIAMNHTHAMIAWYCDKVHMAQNFKSLWSTVTSMHVFLVQLDPIYLSLYLTQLSDAVLAVLNSWHLKVQRYALEMLAILSIAQHFPVFKVAVELLRCYIFYGVSEGCNGQNVMKDLSEASLDTRKQLITEVIALSTLIKNKHAEKWCTSIKILNDDFFLDRDIQVGNILPERATTAHRLKEFSEMVN